MNPEPQAKRGNGPERGPPELKRVMRFGAQRETRGRFLASGAETSFATSARIADTTVSRTAGVTRLMRTPLEQDNVETKTHRHRAQKAVDARRQENIPHLGVTFRTEVSRDFARDSCLGTSVQDGMTVIWTRAENS